MYKTPLKILQLEKGHAAERFGGEGENPYCFRHGCIAQLCGQVVCQQAVPRQGDGKK